MNKKLLYPLLVLIGAAGLAWLLLATKPAPEADPYTPPPTTVRVITVQKVAEHLSVRSQGTVQPRTESQLTPEVSGRVVWMSPSLIAGGSFESGDTLLRIDDADYQNAVERGQATVQRAKVEREHAAEELARLRKLHVQKLASQSQLDDAQRLSRVASATLIEASVGLKQSQRDLGRTEVIAPFTGRVRNEQVDLGQFVSRGGGIATIYATDYVEIRLPIASSQLSFLGLALTTQGEIAPELAPPVTISGEYGNIKFIWNGVLVRMEAEIDARSRMIYGVTRIKNNEVENLPTLAIGLFVQADIQGRLVEDIIRLPRSAMRDENQVLVVDAEDRLRFRQISVLRMEHDEVLISKGLESGERVCISPLQTVVDGMTVRPISG